MPHDALDFDPSADYLTQTKAEIAGEDLPTGEGVIPLEGADAEAFAVDTIALVQEGQPTPELEAAQAAAFAEALAEVKAKMDGNTTNETLSVAAHGTDLEIINDGITVTNEVTQAQPEKVSFQEKRSAFEAALANAGSLDAVAEAIDAYAIEGEIFSNTGSGNLSAEKAKRSIREGYGGNIADTGVQNAIKRLSEESSVVSVPVATPEIVPMVEVLPEPEPVAQEAPEEAEVTQVESSEATLPTPEQVTASIKNATTFAELASVLDGAEQYQDYKGENVSLEEAKAQFNVVMKGIERWQNAKTELGQERNEALNELDRLIHGDESRKKLGGTLGARISKLAEKQNLWMSGSPDVR